MKKEETMKANILRYGAFTLALLFGAGVLTVESALAQKKKKEAPAPVATVAQTVPQTAMKTVGTIREVLNGMVGKTTNLGTLAKIAGDYAVFEGDGDTTFYPLSALQSVKMRKPEEEGGEMQIEIRFLNKD
jgi:hypothetical protein